jgi:hypothetical protein
MKLLWRNFSAAPPFAARRKSFAAVLFLGVIFWCDAVPAQTLAAAHSSADGTGGIDPASSPMAVFTRARASVEAFLQQSANVVCTENVTQAVVGKNGKASYREDSVFDYQLQANTNSGAVKIVETRDTRKAAFRDSARTLLITNGFTAMLLIMHSSYEASYTFEPGGEENVEGVSYVKINFKPVAGASSPVALQLRGQNYPLPLSGTIWIEPQSGAVVKLVASLDSNLTDVGLQSLRSEIHYTAVRFHDPEESYWVPASAIIDLETLHRHWRNVHRFTGYRRFRATIRVENMEAKQ